MRSRPSSRATSASRSSWPAPSRRSPPIASRPRRRPRGTITSRPPPICAACSPCCRRTTWPTRATSLLELGEQELLSADLVRARGSFRRAIEAARAIGDAVTLARAALGFAGGDVGFGWEIGTDDPAAVELLREGLEALGDSEPRLALRMTFRLAYLLVFTEDRRGSWQTWVGVPRRWRSVSATSKRGSWVRFTELVVRVAARDEVPPSMLDLFRRRSRLCSPWPRVRSRGSAVSRGPVVRWRPLRMARIPECEEAIEHAAAIAAAPRQPALHLGGRHESRHASDGPRRPRRVGNAAAGAPARSCGACVPTSTSRSS